MRMDSSGSGDQHYLRSSQSPSRRVLGPSSAANEPEASADGNHVFRAPNPVGKKRNSLSDIDHQVTPSRDLRRSGRTKPAEPRPSTSGAAASSQEQNSQSAWRPKLSIDEFDIGRELGKGRFATVFLCREKQSKFVLAMKVMTKKEVRENKYTQQLRREVEIHSHLRHPNILEMFAYFKDEKRVYFLLEFAPGGELFKELKNCERFDDPRSADYISQVATGLTYLHNLKVVHRDIKPENMLIGYKGVLKIADFGSSAHLPSSRRTALCGTLDYMPPEMLANRAYDHRVDVWATGVVLFEFLVGRPPFFVEDKDETLRRIQKVDYHFPEALVSSDARDLIGKMLREDPNERLSLLDLMRHPWIVRNSKNAATDETKKKIVH